MSAIYKRSCLFEEIVALIPSLLPKELSQVTFIIRKKSFYKVYIPSQPKKF